MIFKSNEHEQFFNEYATSYKHDHERLAMFYCLGLLDETRTHIKEIYDFEERCIRPDCLLAGWQTGGTIQVIELAYNLYNNFGVDKETDYPRPVTPLEIFMNAELAEYFWQAIKLRFNRMEGVTK